MGRVPQRPASDKISPSLYKKLEGLEPGQHASLVVILHLPDGRPHRETDRSAVIEATKAAAEPVLEQIDHVLRQYGGIRHAGGASALGSAFIEATPGAALALAALEGVKAIIEDQTIHPAK